MARAVVIIILLLALTGCAQQEGECVRWAKHYVNEHSMWHTQHGERPNLPAIAIVRTGPESLHAVVVVDEDDEFYLFVDNGFLGGDGLLPKPAVLYWLRRRP